MLSGSKKVLAPLVLKVLHRHSDDDHPLTQDEIGKFLQSEYSVTVDRKTVKRCLDALVECGYPIEYRTHERTRRDPRTGEEETQKVATGFFFHSDITDGEATLLLHGVMSVPHISARARRDLVQKIKQTRSEHFPGGIEDVDIYPQNIDENHELFYNIEILGEAIRGRRKVSFHYLAYDTDKRLRVRRRGSGQVREYTVSPYFLAMREGKYYVICNHDSYDNAANYRLDRIQSLKVLREEARDFRSLAGSGGAALDIPRYLRRHPYMYAGKEVHVKMCVARTLVDDVIETFDEVRFLDTSAPPAALAQADAAEIGAGPATGEGESEGSTPFAPGGSVSAAAIAQVTDAGEGDFNPPTRARDAHEWVTFTAMTNDLDAVRFARINAPLVQILSPRALRENLRRELADALLLNREG